MVGGTSTNKAEILKFTIPTKYLAIWTRCEFRKKLKLTQKKKNGSSLHKKIIKIQAARYYVNFQDGFPVIPIWKMITPQAAGY